ncbi:hypothetical protein ONZ45_g13163 [Pleurotus djamor]|nr:hypothetical protein ONZ45_g13163 [Pleurotus djamor]
MGLLQPRTNAKPGFTETKWRREPNGKRRRIDVLQPLAEQEPETQLPSTSATPPVQGASSNDDHLNIHEDGDFDPAIDPELAATFNIYGASPQEFMQQIRSAKNVKAPQVLCIGVSTASAAEHFAGSVVWTLMIPTLSTGFNVGMWTTLSKPIFMTWVCQLFRARLFPASVKRPSTAFTFELLDELHLQRMECKTASSNFYSLLRRRTSLEDPLALQDRAREMERVSRCYRDLVTRATAGEFDLKVILSNGALALACPVCPQLGINLTPLTYTPNDPDWLVSPLLVADGNFKFDHLQMKRPDLDIFLRDGASYAVNSKLYQAHLQTTEDTPTRSTCANHKAVNQSSRTRRHVDSTGIGAIACARHAFFVPHSVVYFTKGEQQRNMDFAFSEAMDHFSSLWAQKGDQPPGFTLIYDVNCQYSIHQKQRFEKAPYLKHPPGRIQYAVGKFHLGAHVESCYAKYSLNYVLGAGQTDGEVLETLWAPLNKIAGSTRAMTLGHRQEVLDDAIYDSNWKKLTLLASSLVKKWNRAVTTCQEMEEAYEDLRSRIDLNLLTEWDAEGARAISERGEALSVFDVVEPNGRTTSNYVVFQVNLIFGLVPSVSAVRLELSMKELRSKRYLVGGAAVITEGMAIQESQLSLKSLIRAMRDNPSVAQQIDLADRRGRLRKRLERFRRRINDLLPGLVEDEDENHHESDDDDDDDDDDENVNHDIDHADDGSEIMPEDMTVLLPSAMGPEGRARHGYATLAKEEARLQEGRIYDSLKELRMALGEKSLRFRKVLRNNRSQKQSTRAWGGINAYDSKARLQVSIYSTSVEALKSLVGAEADKWLPINQDTDLQMRGDVVEKEYRRKRKRVQI